MDNYYVYIYLDPRKKGNFKDLEFENEPFYIGKGIHSRYLRHLKDTKYNPLKINKIKKIQSMGLSPIIIKFEKRIRLKKEYPVIRIDYRLNEVRYNSATKAAKDNNTTTTRIVEVCNGNRFQTKGYLFRFEKHPKLDEFKKIINSKFNKYLVLMNKKIEYKNKIYNNILHIIHDNKNSKISNIFQLLMGDKKNMQI